MSSSSESHGSHDQNPQLFPKGAEQSPGQEKLGRFGHHPDPAIDFEIEVQSIEARLFDAMWGISKPGTEPENVEAVIASIERASSFRVGGDPSAVNAKRILRLLENTARSAISTAPAELQAQPARGGAPIRFLIEEKLPSGAIRWQCVEHEQHAHRLAADCEHPATVTPLCAQQGMSVIAWQPGEREIAERWIVRLMAKVGTKPDYANDLLWLQRIHNLLFSTPTTALPAEATDDWLRDTAMNVMLASEVEEVVRILTAALKGGRNVQ